MHIQKKTTGRGKNIRSNFQKFFLSFSNLAHVHSCSLLFKSCSIFCPSVFQNHPAHVPLFCRISFPTPPPTTLGLHRETTQRRSGWHDWFLSMWLPCQTVVPKHSLRPMSHQCTKSRHPTIDQDASLLESKDGETISIFGTIPPDTPPETTSNTRSIHIQNKLVVNCPKNSISQKRIPLFKTRKQFSKKNKKQFQPAVFLLVFVVSHSRFPVVVRQTNGATVRCFLPVPRAIL